MPNWVDTFVQEAEELLSQVEESALALNEDEDNAEAINQLFRAFHTIKGSSGMCGLDRVAAFTHHVETLLDKVRNGEVPVSADLVDLVLAARDHITALISAERGGEPVSPETTEELIAKLKAASGEASATNRPAKQKKDGAQQSASASAETAWHVHFRPSPDLWACGGNPALLLRDLQKLGPCEIVVHTDRVPVIGELSPHLCYLLWDIDLRSDANENAIRDVFLFVEDGAELKIEKADEGGPVLDESPQDKAKPSSSSSARTPAAERGKRADHVLAKTLTREQSVRVPSERLDRLVSLVGELVMNQSRLAQAAEHAGVPELANPVEEIERLINELRDNVLSIRMLPIGSIFGRFRRLVHDLSGELKKEVDLVTEGADTELDKSILDQLGEPLVHVLRNCIDHGVETAQDRLSAGKPRRGTITIAAVHTGSEVVVSIQDDGRGINRAAVRAKAIERQLITADANLSDRELINLILLPGFSTAREVTKVSGRGVGMDVVKRQIDAMRGSLSIESEEGKGTRISLCLPLTLAIIEGLLVQVERNQFIVPMSAVTENVDLEQAQKAQNNGRNVVCVRGDLVPYIDLRAAFALGGSAPSIEKIVIVAHEGERVGIVVDRVVGTHQTVLQSLGKFYRNVHVVSGATIMGDGRVALILDVPSVVQYVS